MSKKNDENKQSDEENKINNKLLDPLFEKLPNYVSRMWELPQIYEFLCLSKEILHIENLSMYEMERMLTMPKASKQLANIMTSLLSSSVPRSRLIKIPPMPYEFWTNVLLNHKVTNWLKIYENKEHDSMKVLDAIGVEPEFWNIFPNISTICQCKFDELNLRQRIWLLKTVCDTMMHGKKSLQDEVANRYLDGDGEKILGRDRHGTRYIYFPIFLDNDLRIYKYNMNNKILLNVTPIAPKLKIHTRRIYNRRDRRKKKCRWKNGNLPLKQKKRQIKVIKIASNEVKCNIKIEQTEMVTVSINGNNSNVDLNTNTNSNKDIKNEMENKEEIVNSFSTSKLSDVNKNDEQPHSDNVSNSSKTDDEKINEIKTITSSSSSTVSTLKINNGVISKSDDEKLIDTKIIIDNNDKSEKTINNNVCLNDQIGLNTWMNALSENNDSKVDIQKNYDENSRNSFTECSDSASTKSKTICEREMNKFNSILADLGVSTFQLVADNVESLRELVSTLSAQNSTISTEPVRCEMLLIKKLRALLASLTSKETFLKESSEKSREKLRHEYKNFQDGITDDDTNNCNRYTSEWVLGSQGCPLLSSGETVQHADDENENVKSESEKNDGDDEEDETKEKTESRRVLRARGVSSYMEQFSSDDDTDSSQPEGWAEIVDPTTGIHLGMSAVQTDGTADDDDESQQSGSDQDWILPGKRKRKNKRMSTRRFKTLQNKLQTMEVDFKNSESPLSLDIENKPRKIRPKNTLNTIKIESVHSEFHIKDEEPIVNPPTTNACPIVRNDNVQQNYVLQSVVNTPNGPMNYVVMPNDNTSVAQPSTVVSMMPQAPMQSGYFVQNAQGYLVSNPQLTQVRSPFVNPPNLQSMHSVIIQQNHHPYVTPPNDYIQYPQMRMASPMSLYPPIQQQQPPPPLPPLMINQPSKFLTQQTKMQPRIVQNRQIVPPYRPRHPVGAVIRSTMPFRALDIRPVIGGRVRGGRLIAPRNPTGTLNIRPTKTNTVKRLVQKATAKPTSLIVLSDSDDEIEMIIPEKTNETAQEQTKNKTQSSVQNKVVDNNNRPAIASATGSEQQSSSQAVLTPQIIQRMSQGGISITPIKPKTPNKSSSISATQLVVVVNETGSHYALALPNGSKLILTPEQVAQIRASNGGKLVL